MQTVQKARKLTPKQQEKQNRSRIEAAYYKGCNRVEISVLDMGKVFTAGNAAIAAGADDDALQKVIVAFVETVRKN